MGAKEEAREEEGERGEEMVFFAGLFHGWSLGRFRLGMGEGCGAVGILSIRARRAVGGCDEQETLFEDGRPGGGPMPAGHRKGAADPRLMFR